MQTNVELFSESYWILWFLGIGADCAVNCFALISGYVYYEREIKYTNLLRLHLIVLFYGISLTIAISLLVPDVTTNVDLVRILFPVSGVTYWYYTAYFGLFFFMPILNYGMQMLTKKQANAAILSIVILFSVIPTITRTDIFAINRGLSMLWLVALYLIGTYLKKYRNELCQNKARLLLMYFACVTITWGLKLGLEIWSKRVWSEAMDFSMLVDYCSPTILFASIALVLLFSSVKLSKSSGRMLSNYAPVSFSVYIIHEHPAVRRKFIKDRMIPVLAAKPWEQVAIVIGLSVGIWILCLCLDRIRKKVFDVFKIDEILENIENKIGRTRF